MLTIKTLSGSCLLIPPRPLLLNFGSAANRFLANLSCVIFGRELKRGLNSRRTVWHTTFQLIMNWGCLEHSINILVFGNIYNYFRLSSSCGDKRAASCSPWFWMSFHKSYMEYRVHQCASIQCTLWNLGKEKSSWAVWRARIRPTRLYSHLLVPL